MGNLNKIEKHIGVFNYEKQMIINRLEGECNVNFIDYDFSNRVLHCCLKNNNIKFTVSEFGIIFGSSRKSERFFSERYGSEIYIYYNMFVELYKKYELLVGENYSIRIELSGLQTDVKDNSLSLKWNDKKDCHSKICFFDKPKVYLKK